MIYAGANIAEWHIENRERTRLGVLLTEIRLAAYRLARTCAQTAAADYYYCCQTIERALERAAAGGAL